MSSNVQSNNYAPPSKDQHPDGAALAEQQRALRIQQQVWEEHRRAVGATTQSGEADRAPQAHQQAPQAHQQAADGAAPARFLGRLDVGCFLSPSPKRGLPDCFTSEKQVERHWEGLNRDGRIAFARLWGFDLSRESAQIPEKLSDPAGKTILAAIRNDLRRAPDSLLGRMANAFRRLF